MDNSIKSVVIPRALIVSDYSILAASLSESLRKKGCEVSVISTDNRWYPFAISTSNSIQLYAPDNLPSENFNYVLVLDLHQSGNHSTYLDSVIPFVQAASKFVIVMPLERAPNFQSLRFESEDPTPQYFFVAPIVSEQGEISTETLFSSQTRPVEVGGVLSHLERALFSFAEQKKIGIVGNPFSVPHTEQLLQQPVDELITIPRSSSLDELLRAFLSRNEKKPTISAPIKSIEIPQTQPISVPKSEHRSILSPLTLQDTVNERIEEASDGAAKSRRKRPSFSLPTVVYTTNFFSKIRRYGTSLLVICVVIFIVLPALLLSGNVVLLKTARNQVIHRNYQISSNLFSLSSTLSSLNQQLLHMFSLVPYADKLYETPLKLSANLQRLSTIGDKGIHIIMQTDVLLESVVDKEVIDTDALSRSLSLELDTVITELSFLESKISSSDSIDVRLITSIISRDSLTDLREQLLSLKIFIDEAPTLLGVTNPQRYVIALQDYSVSRPTGGVITYLIVPTFSGGKLIDIDTLESDYVDSHFKGEAEVPYELAKFFNQAEWSVRDAGFDLEFAPNAQNVLRFLDNAISLTANGVVGVDQQLIADLSGKQTVSSASEIETSIQSIIQTYVSSSLKNRAELYSNLYQRLRNNTMQIYLVNENLELTLEQIGYAGAITMRTCQTNCYSDIVGVLEIGDTSVSEDAITRSANMSVSFEEGLIKRELVYKITNSSSLRQSGTLNLVATDDAGFGLVSQESTAHSTTIKPEVLAEGNFKKAIIPLVLQPSETSIYTFTWESGSNLDLNSKGDYSLYLRSQPGIPKFPIEVSVLSEGTRTLFGEDHSLTNDGIFRYNTELDRDTELTITW